MAAQSHFSGVRVLVMLACWISGPTSVWGQVASDAVDSDAAATFGPKLFLEPIEGITTARHPMPAEFSVPLGTQLRVWQEAPEGATLDWTGATAIERGALGSTAICIMDSLGVSDIAVSVTLFDGTTWENVAKIKVIDVGRFPADMSAIRLLKSEWSIDGDSTNGETVAAFYMPSIATVTQLVGEGGRKPMSRKSNRVSATRRFRTSVHRPVTLSVAVEPAELGPLMEWSLNGEARLLGSTATISFGDVGLHEVSVGPPSRREVVEFETYRVEIVSHQSNFDIVPEQTWITFEARTNPPGSEDSISWLSSTSHGEARPRFGRGSTFTVYFENTWGLNAEDDIVQWLGARADNAAFNQDGKGTANCQFVEDPSQTFGFDSFTNRNDTPVVPIKSVENGQTDTAILNSTPSSPETTIHLVSSNTGIVQVLPATVSSSVETVTVGGASRGTANIETRVNSASGTSCGRMVTTSYPRRTKTLAIILVHEDSGINSTDVGSAASIQTALNQIYKQSLLRWTVTKKSAVTTNFDLNGDGKIDVTGSFMGNSEMQAVRNAARDDTFDHNVFLVDNPNDGSGGFAGFNQRYALVHVDAIVGAGVSGVAAQVIAHELGHAQGMAHVYESGQTPVDTTNVMDPFFNNGAGKQRLRKNQWDQLNP